MTVPYAKRFAGGFFDLPSQTTQIDSAFFNAVEAALIQLCAVAPSGNQVPIWVAGNSRFEPGQIADAQVAAAAAIAISKLASYPADATKALKGDGSWGQIVDAMVASGAALAISKLAGYPADATKALFGDGSWKVPSTGAMVQLYDSTLGGSAANFDITSISQAYNHLRLVLLIRGDAAGGTAGAFVRFNNDSGTNYYWNYVQGNGTGAQEGEGLGQSSGAVHPNTSAASATANYAGICTVEIPCYVQTTFDKDWTSTYTARDSAASSHGTTGVCSGQWINTAAITRITILPASGNFIAGSRATLYGIL